MHSDIIPLMLNDPITRSAAKAISDHERKKKRRVPKVQTSKRPDYQMPPKNAGTPRSG